jgi:hypothetical protein
MIVLQGAILALLIIAVGAVGFYSIARMGESGRALYAEAVEGLGTAAAMGEDFATLHSVLRDMCIDTDPAANRWQKKLMDEGRASLRENMKALLDSAKTNPDKEPIAEEAARRMEAYFGAADAVMNLAMANRNAEAIQNLRSAAVLVSSAFRGDLAKLKGFMRDRVEDRMDKSEAALATSSKALALCLAAAVALAATATALLAAARR